MPRGTPLIKELAQDYKLLNEKIEEQGPIEARLNGLLAQRENQLALINQHNDKGLKLTREMVDETKKIPPETEKFGNAIRNIAPGLVSMAKSAYDTYTSFKDLLPAGFGFVGIAVAIGAALLKVQEAITDTRKELGVSAIEAAKITAQNKILGQVVKAYGLDVEDIKSAQAAIRQNLGASAKEAVSLSVSFAKTSAFTGQSSEDLAKTLSIMESMSGASREVLLNQIRSNAAMIEAAGIAPALVMQDIASNSEFFASFAKEGGQNLIQAATAARKLGLDMSTVASVTESLLDFESSIEASMEASMLLGRNINTDRARQLALIGDQKGLMEEVRRIVGDEADFEAMNVLERRALGKAFGTSVEELSRLVRNNTATATTATAAPAGGDGVFNELAAQTPYLQTMAKGIKEMATG